jgi:hypothetical protein
MGYVTILFVSDVQFFREHQPAVVFWVMQLTIVPVTVKTRADVAVTVMLMLLTMLLLLCC